MTEQTHTEQSYSWEDQDRDRGRFSTDDLGPDTGDAIAMLEVQDGELNREVAVYISADQAEELMAWLGAVVAESRRS